MGTLDDPLNTFWQLLTVSSGGAWRLTTPPGVATNGGLSVAALPSTVLAGVQPSEHLRFSPLATSTDQGSTWATGLVPGGLARTPDSLAQGEGIVLALQRTGRGRVASSSGDLSRWAPMTSATALDGSSPTPDCAVTALTAVAVDAVGTPLVGASCRSGQRTGLFARSSSGWALVGPGIPGYSGAPTRVIRLDQTTAGVVALVTADSGVNTRLFGLWSANGLRTWTVSSALELDGAHLLSTGVTPTGGFVVATSGGGRGLIASTVGPTAPTWRRLPSLPSGATSVAATPDGTYDALAPRGSILTIYELGTAWRQVQRFTVAIQYGSSG